MNEILEALKAKYEGVSETILKVTANSMAKKGLLVASVEETTLEQVVTAYGDYRATEAAKTAKKDIKPATEEKPVEKQDDKPAEEIPTWAKAIVDQNTDLANKLAAMEGEKVNTARRTQIDALVQGLPEKLRSPYKRISVDAMTDDDFAALQLELKTEVDVIAAEVKAYGTSFITPPSAPGGSAVNEATAQQAADLVGKM